MKKLWLGLLVGVAVVLGGTAPAYADVNDFTIERFEADYTLSNADKQGQLRVVEHIAVNFTDNNHGLLRAIPNDYKKHRLQLKIEKVGSASGAPAQYTMYAENGNTVLKIGDPDKTVTGRQSYNIAYTVRNVIGFYDNHDELYWDINGDQWRQTAQEVAVALHLPPSLKLSQHKPICYTGAFGSTEQACTITHDTTSSSISAQTTKPLAAYQTLSIVAGFDKGYFRPATWYETAGEYAATAAKFLIPFVLLAGMAGRYWYRNGRDPKGRGVIVPEYQAPDGLRPIEVGTMADFKTDNHDITATIIDLAIRGYIKIIETVQVRKLRKDLKLYSLRLEKTDFSGLKDFEVSILQAIFAKQEVGEEIDLGVLKYKLQATATTLRKNLHDSLVARKYLYKSPLSAVLRFAGLFGLACLVGVALAVAFGPPAVMGLIAGAVVSIVFFALMPSRTAKGVAAKESILGLKKYLEVAESERIKKLQSPDAPYAAKSAEPKRTVELFEKLLPYAIVLGVEQQWAKKFADIYRTPPDWYQGNWTTFNAIYLATALSSGVQAGVNEAFSSPSSSSGSGFSGGGAGGGGGGGGGGGW